MLKSIVLFLLFSISFSLVAKDFAPPASPSMLSVDAYKEMLKKAEARFKDRRPSSDVIDDSLMSPILKEFREKFLKVNTSDEFALLVGEIEKNIANAPADYKFVGTQFLLIKPFRGIVYRMMPMVEKQRIAHSAVVTMVKNIASSLSLYFPNSGFESAFQYVTEPFFIDEKPVKRFKEMSEFQYFMGTEVYAALTNSINVLSSLDFAGKPVLWDNRFVFGSDSFEDGLARYRVLNESDRNFRLSTLNGAAQSISLFVAYHADNILELMKDRGRLIGVDGFLGGEIEGTPSVKRVEALCQFKECRDRQWKSKYKGLYTLKASHGKEWMKRAFLHLEQAFRYTKIGWSEVKNLPDNEYFVWNPSRLLPWSRQIERNLDNIEAMLKGPTAVRSIYTGEVVTVNIPALFENPPSDLKAMLPMKWDLKEKTKKVKSLEYPNYYWGRPTEWNLETYKPYMEVKSSDDIKKSVRVLSQAWGGWFAAIPLSKMVQ